MRMPFGKHKGKDLRNVPEDYLCWVLDNCDNISPFLRMAILRVLEGSGSAGSRETSQGGREDLLPLIQSWFRALALKHHPDRGGSDIAMQVVNEAYETLCQRLLGSR